MSISTHFSQGFQISQPFSKIKFPVFHNSRNTLQETTEQSICRARPLVVARLPAHRAALLPLLALQAPLKPPSLRTPDLLWDVRRHRRDLVQVVRVDGEDRAGGQADKRLRLDDVRARVLCPDPAPEHHGARVEARCSVFIDTVWCFHNCSSIMPSKSTS